MSTDSNIDFLSQLIRNESSVYNWFHIAQVVILLLLTTCVFFIYFLLLLLLFFFARMLKWHLPDSC